LTQPPLISLEQGKFNDIEGLTMGVNKNEDSLFICPQYANITMAQYVANILFYFGAAVGQEVLRMYPGANYPTPIAAMVDVFSDNIFKCPSKFMADALSSHGVKTFFYSFNHLPSFSNQPCLGVAHSYELPFIYQSVLPAFSSLPLTQPEDQLSRFMRSSWTSFAKSNDPNTGGSSAWPSFEARTSNYIVLDIPVSKGSQLLGSRCAFWRKHICALGTAHCDS